MSLRKLVDAGFKITLDDKTFRVYNKDNNKTIFKGKYEKPNWVVEFEVAKIDNLNNEKLKEYDNYSCTAFIANDNEFLGQSQMNLLDNQMSISEGVNSEQTLDLVNEVSVIGRENLKELIDQNNTETISNKNNDNSLINRIINVEDLKDLETLKYLLIEKPKRKYRANRKTE